MEKEKIKVKKPTKSVKYSKTGEPDQRGAKPGSNNGGGRRPGQTNKLTAKLLLDKVSERGVPFEEGLAEDYLNSAGDKELRFKYNQLFLNKVMADLKHVEIDETSTVENRQLAFLKALETIGTVALQQDTVNIIDTVEPKSIPNCHWDD